MSYGRGGSGGYVALVPSGSYSSSSAAGYSSGSGLEYKVSNSEAAVPKTEVINLDNPVRIGYGKKDSYAALYLNSQYRSYNFIPDDFLNPARPRTKFIGAADEVIDHIKETFMLMTGREFPDDIVVNICDKKQMKNAHPSWHDGIQGFAINRKNEGKISEIFALNGELDKLMLTIGHEIGHVMSRQLENPVEEEAKAFAFSFAWMDTIVKHDIGGLAGNINISTRPANNGIHNAGFDFVAKLLKQGKDAFDIFAGIISRSLMM